MEGRKHQGSDVEWQKSQYRRNNMFIEDIGIQPSGLLEQNYSKLMQMLHEYEKEQKKQEESLSKYMYSAQKSDWIIQRNKRNVQKIKTKSQIPRLSPLDSNLTSFQQQQIQKQKNSHQHINFIRKNVQHAKGLDTSVARQSSPLRRQNSHQGPKDQEVPQNLSLEWDKTKQLHAQSRRKARVPLVSHTLRKEKDNEARLSCKSFVVLRSREGGPEERVGGRRDTQQFEIASLTKSMTMWVCLRMLEDLLEKDPSDLYIRVGQKAASIKGTSAHLKHGDILTCLELFYGLMLPSGNDAAWALAEAFGLLLTYSQSPQEQDRRANEIIDPETSPIKTPEMAFLAEMNRTCQELGLDDTHYANPHGLGNRDNLSTAMDQAKLAAVVMQHPTVRTVVATQEYSLKVFNDLNDQMTRESTWTNTNKLLGGNCRVVGLKTGITNPAGGCLATAYSIPSPEQGLFWHYYIVTLGSLDTAHRFIDTQKVINRFIVPLGNTCHDCSSPSCSNNR